MSDGVKPTVQESIADPSGYGDPSIGAELARKLAESQVGSVALGVDDGARYVVGAVDDIPPGSRKVILVNGREIGVFNVNGEFFAVLNRCPHQGGPLCSGRQTGFLVAPTPGDYQLSRPGEVIRCPWHGWEFDLRSRSIVVRAVEGPRAQLRCLSGVWRDAGGRRAWRSGRICYGTQSRRNNTRRWFRPASSRGRTRPRRSLSKSSNSTSWST